jgi:hypothetical protein
MLHDVHVLSNLAQLHGGLIDLRSGSTSVQG